MLKMAQQQYIKHFYEKKEKSLAEFARTTENIEFKYKFTEEIYKEVIAFANTDGGVLYIGIDND